jgi:two-component system nitrogen regulation sensor histidine kinase GlnL
MEVFGDDRPVEREPVNIHVVLDHVKRLAKNGFARGGSSFIEDYDPSLPPVYRQPRPADPGLPQPGQERRRGDRPTTRCRDQALDRVPARAYRMSVPGKQDPSAVSLPLEFCVQDNGPGVPPDLLPILFDPFVTTKPNGSGLGLALVAKIIGDHGGVDRMRVVPRGPPSASCCRCGRQGTAPAFRDADAEGCTMRNTNAAATYLSPTTMPPSAPC